MTSSLVQPEIDDPLTAPFWQAARERRLVVQECLDCAALRFPPQAACPHCASLRRGWRDVSGRGRIWSFVVSHPPSLPAFQDFAPFPIALVELDEAPNLRMVGNLVANPGAAINSAPPGTYGIGTRVQVCFHDQDETVTLPFWQVDTSGSSPTKAQEVR